jgi:hypothetical protein
MAVTRDTLETIFGRSNIRKWADLDNDDDEATIAERIAYAIAWAEANFTSLTLGGPAVPASSVVVDDVKAKYAGIWLYESRGITDDDATKSPIAHHRKYCENWIRAFMKNSINFTVPTAPFIVP